MAARISEEKLKQVERLVEDGASINEIRRTLHVTGKTVKRYFPKAGWTFKQGGEYGYLLRGA